MAVAYPRDIAVIGCGYWGKNLVRNFSDLGALRWVCDANPQAVAIEAQRYPAARATVDVADILDDDGVRGVVIATPAANHYLTAHAALDAGKDVFVEKPLALRYAEGVELV